MARRIKVETGEIFKAADVIGSEEDIFALEDDSAQNSWMTYRNTASPDISRLFVARRLKGAWMVAFPTEGCAGVVDTTSSSTTEEKAADMRLSVAVVEEA